MKRIGLLHGDISHGICYQRGHIPLRRLRDKFEFIPISADEFNHAKAFYLDAIVIFHPYHLEHARLIHRAKSHYGIPIIVDIDDLLTNLPSDHREFDTFQGNRLEEILTLSDHVVVSTEYLRDTWAHLNGRMTVIENSIDLKRYETLFSDESRPQLKPGHSGFVVGWTGSQSHMPDLHNTGFVDGLAQFMRKYNDVRAYFHILCPQSLLDEFGVRVVFNPTAVDYLDYPALCYTFPFDVCAVPLHDHPFNNAKSDLRLLDMAPFRIPIIASPRKEFLRHEYTRVLIAKDHQWLEALEEARNNHARMLDQAEQAFVYVMNQRHSILAAKAWEAVLRLYL